MKGRVLALLTLPTACSLGHSWCHSAPWWPCRLPHRTAPPPPSLWPEQDMFPPSRNEAPPGLLPGACCQMLLAADGTPQGLDWETCPTSPVPQKDRKVFIQNYFGLAFVARTTPATWVGEGKDCGSGDSWRDHPTPLAGLEPPGGEAKQVWCQLQRREPSLLLLDIKGALPPLPAPPSPLLLPLGLLLVVTPGHQPWKKLGLCWVPSPCLA